MFYQCPMGEKTLEDISDKANIREVIDNLH